MARMTSIHRPVLNILKWFALTEIQSPSLLEPDRHHQFRCHRR